MDIKTIKYYAVNLVSTGCKFSLLMYFSWLTEFEGFGEVIYLNSLTLVCQTLFSTIVLLPLLEQGSKVRGSVGLYLLVLSSIVCLAYSMASNARIAAVVCVLAFLNMFVDFGKKMNANDLRKMVRHEFKSGILYLIVFIGMFKNSYPILVSPMIYVIAYKLAAIAGLNGSTVSIKLALGYTRSSIFLTLLSFVSSNFIFVAINSFIDEDVFDKINKYRLIIVPIGVFTGFMENRLLKRKEIFFSSKKLLIISLPFFLLSLLVGEYSLLLVSSVIAAFLMSVVRLNNMYFRKLGADSIIFKGAIVNVVISVTASCFVVIFWPAYYIYFPTILSLSLISWMYKREIEGLRI